MSTAVDTAVDTEGPVEPAAPVDTAGFRIEKGLPDAVELAAVIAVLCARNAALAPSAVTGPAPGPGPAHWPRRAGGALPATVGWSGRSGGAWQSGL